MNIAFAEAIAAITFLSKVELRGAKKLRVSIEFINSILPAIIGVFATIVAIFLLIADKNDKGTVRSIKPTATIPLGTGQIGEVVYYNEGSLPVLCLAVIFATLVYYFG